MEIKKENYYHWQNMCSWSIILGSKVGCDHVNSAFHQLSLHL